MQTLSAKELEKLAKLCGLFSSHRPAEIASAAVKANAFLAEHGLTWRDVLRLPLSCEIADQADPTDPLSLWPRGWRAAVEFCLDHPDRLTQWETEWLNKVRGYYGNITLKQAGILRPIVDKLTRAGCRPQAA